MSRTFLVQAAVWSTAVAVAYGCSSPTPSQDGGGAGGGGPSGAGGKAGTGGSAGASASGGSSGVGAGGVSGAGGSAGKAGSGGTGPSGAGMTGAAGNGGASGQAQAGSGGASGAGMAGATGASGAGSGSGGRGGNGSGGMSGGPTAGAAGMAVGGAGGSGSNGMSAGCGKAPGIPSNQYNNGKPISIMVGSMQRRFVLSVPTNYDNTHPYRLVVSFHQRDGNDIQNYNWQYYGLLPLSNNTTIFVAPNGQLNNSPCSGMGDGETSCGWPNPNNTDFALADAVVAQIEANFCVDTNRIFATGWSFGGAMSYETACARPLGAANGYIRGVAVYSGSPQITQGPCPPMKQVAYYGSHGTQDNVLQPSGGVSMAQDFAKINGCTWQTPATATGAHVCTTLMGCMSGYPVEFCSFVGPHTPFPDNGQSQGSWGPQEAWKFLSQF